MNVSNQAFELMLSLVAIIGVRYIEPLVKKKITNKVLRYLTTFISTGIVAISMIIVYKIIRDAV